MPANNLIDKNAAYNNWGTPEHVLDCVRAYLRGPIPLDPATSDANPTGALRFFTEADDGLMQDWAAPCVFVNPPYANVNITTAELKARSMAFGLTRTATSYIALWAAKIGNTARAGVPIIALLPCGTRFSTAYWQDNILIPELRSLCFVRGRLKFTHMGSGELKSGQNNSDSLIYGFGTNVSKFADAFSSLGPVFATCYQRKRADILDGFI